MSSFTTAVTTQSDGKVVEVGARSTYGPGTVDQDFVVVRLNTDGSRDGSFGTDGKVVTDIGTIGDVAQAVAVQPDGKIVVAGQDQQTPGGNEDLVVVRYEVGGTLDPSFGNGGIAIVHDAGFADFAYAVGVEPDGSIVAAGNQYGTQNGANNDFLIVRLTSNGQLDSSFGSGGEVADSFQSGNANQAAYALAVQPDGRVVVAGFSSLWSGTPPSDFALERFNTDGTLDSSFGTGARVLTDFGNDSPDSARALALQSDGKIVATGGTSNGIGLARYNTDGSLDTTFGNGGTEVESSTTDVPDTATGIAIDGSGRIVVGGDGATLAHDLVVARFERDGSPDPTFGSGGFAHDHFGQGGDYSTGMALEPDGNIVIADGRDGALAATRFLAAPLGSTYVSASGTSLRLDGQPFRPVGINIYNANSTGNCWYSMASGSTLDDAQTAIGSGANTIRAWFFQDLATSNGKRNWSAFDHTLAVARAHGVKVIATLGNQWADCETAAGYKNTAWYESGYKQPDPGGTVSYRAWVQEVAARYGDDTTILAWQLLNEPEVMPYKGANCGATIGETTAEHDLQAWAQDVSGAIKAVDANHLISLGTIGGGQCGTQGNDYKTVMSTSTLDLCEFHDYTPSQPIPGDQFNGLQVRIDQCGQLDKPLLVGELGVKPSDVGGTLAARANTVASKLCAQLSAGVAGVLLWAWDKNGSLLNNFDIGPGDPVLDVLSPWSDPAHTCSAPASPSGVVAAAGDRAASVSWLAPTSDGGAPITSYTVTASPGGQRATTDGSTTTAMVPGLTNGQAYTFTVTATNAAGTSEMSSASGSVTPQSGNTAATGLASASSGGTVTTGSDPAASGGIASSVTVPAGTSGGGVTIMQTATNETAPSGYLFGGVQVDIGAPSGTATNPLTLKFTLTPPSDLAAPPDPATLAATQIYRADGSGSPALVPDCPTAGQALPDGSPCVASRQYVTVGAATDIQLTVLTASASHWNSGRPKPGAVTVTDSGYTPQSVTVQPGAYVNWTWSPKKSHSVTDSAGLGASGAPWFDSGLKTSGSYRFTFPAAGSFAYKSTAKGDSITGSVLVPVVITPTSGSTSKMFSVIWSTRTLSGYTFKVQYRFKPTGSTKWTSWTIWKSAVSSTSASFVPNQGPGTYDFQAQVTNTSTGKSSANSPDATISVS